MDKKIKVIINEFNFERVHKAMEALNWTWYGRGVPKIGTLRRSAKDLLTRAAYSDEDISIGSGGFQARRVGDDLELLFYIDNVWASDLGA